MYNLTFFKKKKHLYTMGREENIKEILKKERSEKKKFKLINYFYRLIQIHFTHFYFYK